MNMENVTPTTHENPCVATNGLTDLHLRTPQQLASVLKWRAEALRSAGFDLDATVAESAAGFLSRVEGDCWLCRPCESSLEADDDVPVRENGVVITDDMHPISPNGKVRSTVAKALLERCEEQLRRCGPNWGRYPFEAVVIPAADLRCLLDACSERGWSGNYLIAWDRLKRAAQALRKQERAVIPDTGSGAEIGDNRA